MAVCQAAGREMAVCQAKGHEMHAVCQAKDRGPTVFGRGLLVRNELLNSAELRSGFHFLARVQGPECHAECQC
jgi:hypothetical protein